MNSGREPLRGFPSQIAVRLDRRFLEGVEAVSYRGVTFTSRFFEAGAIENENPAPPVANQASRLNCLRCERHGFPIGAKGVGQYLVRARQGLTRGMVIHCQQPAA